jgi:hypothetical protein
VFTFVALSPEQQKLAFGKSGMKLESKNMESLTTGDSIKGCAL